MQGLITSDDVQCYYNNLLVIIDKTGEIDKILLCYTFLKGISDISLADILC